MKVVAVLQRTNILLALGFFGFLIAQPAQGLLKSPLSLLPLPTAEAESAPLTTRNQEAFPFAVKPGSSVSDALHSHGLKWDDIQQIVDQARPLKNLDQIPAGTKYLAEKDTSQNWRVAFRFGDKEVLEIRQLDDGRWVAHPYQVKIQQRVVTFEGIMQGSSYLSAETSQAPVELIEQLREIFQWQVNFARSPRYDSFRMTVEKNLINGKTTSWGPILAAEYRTKDQEFRAILFRKDGKSIGYFTPEGQPLKQPFLKSPVKLGMVTSLYQEHRLHPILGHRRPHLGVDYGAPYGTPVYAVADGVVRMATHRRQSGKSVLLRHPGGFKTAYKHLSRFAKGISFGSEVKQGQVIGYVGATGLSTGPHLHFELYKDGKRVNPFKVALPQSDSILADDMGEFQLQSARLLLTLPPQVSPEITLRTPASGNDQSTN